VLATIGQQGAVDEFGAVVAIETEERQGQARADAMDGPPDALLPLTPDGLQFDPRGGDVHRAERAQVEALGLRAAVGDEIDLEEAGPGVGPVGEGANRDFVLQDGAGAREGRAARRVLGPGGAEEPGERGAARLAHELVDGREQGELPVPEEAVEQLRHEGVEPMRTYPVTRLPEYLGGGGDRRPVGRGRPPGPGVVRGRGRRRSSRMAALRWMPVTATTSSKSWRFSARVACRYRSRCTAAYSRRLARVTGPSWGGLVTVTSELLPGPW